MSSLMEKAAQSASPDIALAATSWLVLRDRLARARQAEAGMTTETVIITAGLASLAIALVAIIATRVRNRARSIP